MLQTWHTIKGGVAAAVAFVACPCHLPVTLPLLIALTAGTAFGTWLENNTVTVGVISTIIFIGGLALAYKWMTEAARTPETGAQGIQLRQIGRHGAKSDDSKQFVPFTPNGVSKVTLATSPACSSCKRTKAVWEQVHKHANFIYEEVDITTQQGRDLAAKHNIFSTPVTIVNDKVVKRGQLDMQAALEIVGADL